MLNQNLLLGDDGYLIQRSLRFRSSASAYLSRTPSSATNRKTWTYSAWVKRGALSAFSGLLSAQRSGGQGLDVFFNASDYLRFANYNGASYDFDIVTTQVFRDPSSYYHLVFSVDTTQATSTNRIKVYVNGTQITSFSTSSYPTQNLDTAVNNNVLTTIGRDSTSGSQLDGYLTEVNFIDGQALTPSSFGETDVITGVWKPKKYAGTYGTNGFYLNFSDNTSTTTLGYDKSGNSNNWTTNNISLTAGSSYDSMLDVPTLTSESAANYCVLNPISNPNGPIVTASNGNLSLSYSASAGNAPKMALTGTIGMTSGKWYWEWTEGSPVNSFNGITTGLVAGGSANGVEFLANTSGATGSSAATYSGTTFTVSAGDVIGEAFDAGALTLAVYKNGTLQGTWNGIESGKTWLPLFSVGTGGSAGASSANFGQRPFSYTPPTGFLALNTFNLPDATIKAGNKHFDATTYTGDNTNNRLIQNSGQFQPDMFWIKSRSSAYSHIIEDSVRGANWLSSNSTGGDSTNSSLGWSNTAVASNGFIVDKGSNVSINNSGDTYVGWQWKAGGSAVSNTAGSITSQVSANPTAGFSVVTYTGTGANATVGHGLGVAPKMIIHKARSIASQNWIVYHASMDATPQNYVMGLNLTVSKSLDSSMLNNTAPTSSVWSIGTNSSVNTSGATYVAYCFSEVAGYSKFGSYTGNGSSDGTFVYTGFRPKFVLWKRTDSASGNGWYLLDSARNSYNVSGERLFPNLSNAGSNDTQADFLSNGFKLRTTDTDSNASGGTYIYMAFAENPFKYSLAR